jgi:hypothetical protein
MENTAVETTPTAPTEVATPTPTNQMALGGGDDVFESMGSKKPMDLKSILVFGLLIAFSIYGITYYRKAIAKLNQEKQPSDEFLNLVDDVEEVKSNLKRAMGRSYKTAA